MGTGQRHRGGGARDRCVAGWVARGCPAPDPWGHPAPPSPPPPATSSTHCAEEVLPTRGPLGVLPSPQRGHQTFLKTCRGCPSGRASALRPALPPGPPGGAGLSCLSTWFPCATRGSRLLHFVVFTVSAGRGCVPRATCLCSGPTGQPGPSGLRLSPCAPQSEVFRHPVPELSSMCSVFFLLLLFLC